MIVSAACFAGAAALLLAYFFSEKHALLSSMNCRLIQAKVTAKGKSIEERNGMQLQAYHVQYAFTFDGQPLAGSGTVDREWYQWLDPGDETPVFVDTSNPQRNFLKIERDYSLARRLKPICLATIGGLAAAAFSIFSRRRSAASQPSAGI